MFSTIICTLVFMLMSTDINNNDSTGCCCASHATILSSNKVRVEILKAVVFFFVNDFEDYNTGKTELLDHTEVQPVLSLCAHVWV